jgi:hypothetical protein
VSHISKLTQILNSEHEHYLFVNYSFFKKWNLIIRLLIYLNRNYLSCLIFRKKYKDHKNIVVIGLKWNGKNVKRRTTGYAKEFLDSHKNSKCPFCEQKLTESIITTDHIIPLSKGGNNSQVNLVATCLKCNNERGNQDFYPYLRSKNSRYKYKRHIFI